MKERDLPVLYWRSAGKSSVVSVLGVPAGAGEVGQGADAIGVCWGARGRKKKQ